MQANILEAPVAMERRNTHMLQMSLKNLIVEQETQRLILSENVLIIWITIKNLEPVIQIEVSQNEKNKYNILTHIYGI